MGNRTASISTHFIEPLERRRLFTGVTLIAHGYGGTWSDWEQAMGNAIAQQSGALANQPEYLMTVTDPGHDGGPLTVVSTRLGPAPANWASSEIIVFLNWSDVAGSFPFGYERSTVDVGAAVASKLLSTFSIPDLSTPLAQLPIDLIGHSRGASLISEVAKGLGQRGVWVDQETFLDPHPVDGINDPLNLNYGDAAMKVFDNVQYAEDYWRTDGNGTSLDFTGEAVSGAYNLQLSESILSNGGYSIEHSDVHLWYHGTIGSPGGPPYADTAAGQTIGSGWYASPQGPRGQTGWVYSRIAKGTRPAAGLKSAAAYRDAVDLKVSGADIWDNISIANLLADTTITQGSSLSVSTAFEDKNVGGARDATITVGFDRNDNPYDGVFGSGVSYSTSSLSLDTLTASLPTTGVAGAYRVYAKISNGANTRYYYAPGRAIITVPGYEKTWTGPASGGDWSLASNWSTAGAPGAADHVAIYDSAVVLPTTTRIAGLLIGGSGSLDLGTRSLVIDYAGSIANSALGSWNGSAYTGIEALIASGAIRSSALVPAGRYDIASADAGNVLGLSGAQTALWSGQTADATSVLIKFTYAGDANLDGVIDLLDYGQIDGSINAHPQSLGYLNGDFNRDGLIDLLDYGVIDGNINTQGAPL